ncbi:Ger(x)C family spore germination protein [Cohnella lupini]|uniref:Spore germination protein KC n=1 Tax=Cohnella lupini TaxID=1294267 RepID=A0A3D9IJ02_9BACL|nr:Ger(x)C family spore germination protein [Cohnella lupini]RED61637.1 spore germination protein KC [Cohnella lupini]
MKNLLLLLVVVSACFGLTGCWNKVELTDWGFVQAASLDQESNGSIRLTAHIYKPGRPSASGENTSSGKSFIDIGANGPSLLGSSSLIASELGRRLQWSHIRVLLISEELAKSRNIAELLEFFMRNPQTRSNINVMVTQGSAMDYLKIKPFIENTMGQQLLEIGRVSSSYSGRAVVTTLKNVLITSMEEVSTLSFPYLRLRPKPNPSVIMNGLAVMGAPSGRVFAIIPRANTPTVLMLKNQFNRGTLTIPCKGSAENKKASKDSFEITRLRTHITPVITRNDELSLRIGIQIEGTITELVCNDVSTATEVNEYLKRIRDTVSNDVSDTLRLLQKEQADIIGVGNSICRMHNRTWKRWGPDWPRRFAETTFSVDVKVVLLNTGTITGKKT